jgi:hypothetical protein
VRALSAGVGCARESSRFSGTRQPWLASRLGAQTLPDSDQELAEGAAHAVALTDEGAGLAFPLGLPEQLVAMSFGCSLK